MPGARECSTFGKANVLYSSQDPVAQAGTRRNGSSTDLFAETVRLLVQVIFKGNFRPQRYVLLLTLITLRGYVIRMTPEEVLKGQIQKARNAVKWKQSINSQRD